MRHSSSSFVASLKLAALSTNMLDALVLLGTLSLVLGGANAKTYEKFQGLGFGIDTGPGRSIYQIELKGPDCADMRNDTDCDYIFCDDQTCPNSPFVMSGYCFDCLKFKVLVNQCGCDTDFPIGECENNVSILNPFHYYNNAVAVVCYVGKKDIAEDVLGRAAIMEAAVEKAYEVSDKDEGTLKIFNAPEFYWRGPNGAYELSSMFDSNAEFNAINEIGRNLEPLVQQPKFKDWLFIFGTVIAANQTVENATSLQDIEFLNFAPVYKGFDPQTTNSRGMRFLVPKRYVSNIDFLSDIRLSNPYEDETRKDYDSNAWYNTDTWQKLSSWLQDEKDYTMIYNTFFVMNDIIFSLEVCLDHALKVAKDMLVSLLAPGGKVPVGGDGELFATELPGLPQISLVTSAGMNIKSESLVLTSGGAAFLQDGLHPDDTGLPLFADPDTPQPPPGSGNMQTSCHPREGDGFLFGDSDCKNIQATVHNVFASEDEASFHLKGLYKDQMPKISLYPSIDIVDRQPPPVAVPTAADADETAASNPNTPDGNDDDGAEKAGASAASPLKEEPLVLLVVTAGMFLFCGLVTL